MQTKLEGPLWKATKKGNANNLTVGPPTSNADPSIHVEPLTSNAEPTTHSTSPTSNANGFTSAPPPSTDIQPNPR
ncbi:hypothetical protein SO802_022195 [Lithocarpus litseifolius]|uniref:Uncharacterized protein n=1 Tax=Lithocarpus litseifolius TaxID=425828 RepID=A0AAW2CH05_9ROSI